MSILDKVIGAVTPPESDEQRHEAHANARSSAEPGDWLSLILDHHESIEATFHAMESAGNAAEQGGLWKKLAALLTAHSVAEEAAIYPAMASAGEKGHATTAYTEQSAAKLQLALLETLEPLSADYMDKLKHLQGAVLHHVYEEEKNWFPDLKSQLAPAEQERLTRRYTEEFTRYLGTTAQIPGLQTSGPVRTAPAPVAGARL